LSCSQKTKDYRVVHNFIFNTAINQLNFGECHERRTGEEILETFELDVLLRLKIREDNARMLCGTNATEYVMEE
jgi:hypothetical protein